MWKILLAVSISVSLLVGITGWMAFRFAVNTTSRGLEAEVRTSLRDYETLWQARENMLASVSSLMSGMPDVRAAFRTGDQATIRDTAAEVWARVSRESAIFLVSDPTGAVLASLGGSDAPPLEAAIRAATPRFPLQSKGFLSHAGKLWQIVVTPVYVDTQNDPALINVLVAGYPVNRALADSLRTNTGSDFVFSVSDQPIASTLNPQQASLIHTKELSETGPSLVQANGSSFGILKTSLLDIAGHPIAELHIIRSFNAVQDQLDELRRGLWLLWTVAVVVGLALSYLLARRIVEPIEQLDKAAAEVARQNYDTRLELSREDELGRLASTFNSMCVSIQQARTELIRQERLATIGQFATSIVHDLRNPLAAIYGGAEMLVDTGLSDTQVRRLARNIHSAARGIQSLLQDLTNISRGKSAELEAHSLAAIACRAAESLIPSASPRGIPLKIEIPLEVEVLVERSRLERVFFNLISNSLEAIQMQGSISISCQVEGDWAIVEVSDTGPGIDEQLKPHLFEPFATAGKRNGLGLGLALSRQTIRSFGGELWQQPSGAGACFRIRLPIAKLEDTIATRPATFHNSFTD